MSDVRKPGNPGGTRGHNNPVPESKPLAGGSTGASSGGGEVKSPEPLRRGGFNRKTAH